MFPIGDDNSDRKLTPYVNYTFIGLNILVFLVLQGMGGNDAFSYAFSLVPKEVTTGTDLSGVQIVQDALGHTGQVHLYPSPLPVYFNFISSMFMHGGWGHLLGNMLFLWIFGDNIEDKLGHFRYIVFYLICGIAAAFGQIVQDSGSVIPMLGASGAISGVLGGYILLFPRRRVRAILFNFLTEVPAFVAIGIWIVYQIALGYFTDPGSGGVAYAAHIGGFVAGATLVKLFAIGRE
jgi:membrane associated rhomboid family serine protease